MKTIRSLYLIINYKTLIVTALSLISTWICMRYNFQANFPLTLVGIAIVFPVVFSIDSAYKRRERALAIFKKYQAQTGSELKGLAGLGFMYAKTGHPEKAKELLMRIDKREKLEEGVVLEMDRAVIYMGLDDIDKVFYHIERALKQNVGGFYVSSDPLWVPLQNDPRFEPMAMKYKLI